MANERRWINDRFRLRPLYEDTTPFGSAVTGRCDEVLRQACMSIAVRRLQQPLPDVIRQARALLSTAMEHDGLGELYERPGVVRPTCRFPPADQVRVAALSVERAGGEVVAELPLARSVVPQLARWIEDWYCGTRAPRSRQARGLWDALEEAGALSPSDQPLALESRESRGGDGDTTLVGHATVVLQAPGTRLAFDPFLLPPSDRYPPSYQPLTGRELAPLDAVFITHSHPDHFDIGSLLSLGASVPIFVPEVERESLLAIDMDSRLREVGFADVRPLRWFDAVRVGEFRVRALPFFGEQPTTGERFHPEIRNQGNVYLASRDDGHAWVIAADSGRDLAGDVMTLATEARRRYGSVDTLVCGYRGFALYPLNYLFSSVTRFLLFVPPEQWEVRQKIMNDADDTVDLAELWGARRIVPYADGGAPWYWELGLGPRLDGATAEDWLADPPPEAVSAAAALRSGTRERPVPSGVDVTVLRPGDGLHIDRGTVVRAPPHAWPYPS